MRNKSKSGGRSIVKLSCHTCKTFSSPVQGCLKQSNCRISKSIDFHNTKKVSLQSSFRSIIESLTNLAETVRLGYHFGAARLPLHHFIFHRWEKVKPPNLQEYTLPTRHKKAIYRKAIDGKDELERNNKGRNSGTHLTERKANKWTQWWRQALMAGTLIFAIHLQANHK
jgi:hypothetical protein